MIRQFKVQANARLTFVLLQSAFLADELLASLAEEAQRFIVILALRFVHRVHLLVVKRQSRRHAADWRNLADSDDVVMIREELGLMFLDALGAEEIIAIQAAIDGANIAAIAENAMRRAG